MEQNQIPFTIVNSGITEEVVFSRTAVEEIFIPLLQKLKKMQKEKGRRILVMLAAAPGAGKTTLTSFLKYLADNITNASANNLAAGMTDGSKLTVIGMDGFHRYQDYLTSHTMLRDGEEILMVKVKGAPETFDLPLLAERISKVAGGEDCGWPAYDRLLHNPVEDAVQVTGDIILLEGNYLLLEWDGWKKLKEYADYTIRIVAEEELLRDRLIRRKISTGVSEEVAAAFVDYSDMYNVRTCLQESAPADLTLRIEADETWTVED